MVLNWCKGMRVLVLVVPWRNACRAPCGQQRTSSRSDVATLGAAAFSSSWKEVSLRSLRSLPSVSVCRLSRRPSFLIGLPIQWPPFRCIFKSADIPCVNFWCCLPRITVVSHGGRRIERRPVLDKVYLRLVNYPYYK